jgi:hypothetical protein
VALHACRVLQTNEKVIFVTAWQMGAATAQMRYAEGDGYRIVVVPDDIARSLGGLTDLDGKPLVDLGRYRDEWNHSFSFAFVNPVVMTSAERAIYARTHEIAALANIHLTGHKPAVPISETMRLSEAGDPVLGVWEGSEQRSVSSASTAPTSAATRPRSRSAPARRIRALGRRSSVRSCGWREPRCSGQLQRPRLRPGAAPRLARLA